MDIWKCCNARHMSSSSGQWSRTACVVACERAAKRSANTERPRAQEIYGLERSTATFEKLWQLQSVPSFDVHDEVDTCLAPSPPLVYAWGPREALPALQGRVHIIQALLHVLCEDPGVAALLTDPAVAEIHRHPGRYGGMPEIRLPGGAASATALPLARHACMPYAHLPPQVLLRQFGPQHIVGGYGCGRVTASASCNAPAFVQVHSLQNSCGG